MTDPWLRKHIEILQEGEPAQLRVTIQEQAEQIWDLQEQMRRAARALVPCTCHTGVRAEVR